MASTQFSIGPGKCPKILYILVFSTISETNLDPLYVPDSHDALPEATAPESSNLLPAFSDYLKFVGFAIKIASKIKSGIFKPKSFSTPKGC